MNKTVVLRQPGSAERKFPFVGPTPNPARSASMLGSMAETPGGKPTHENPAVPQREIRGADGRSTFVNLR